VSGWASPVFKPVGAWKPANVFLVWCLQTGRLSGVWKKKKEKKAGRKKEGLFGGSQQEVFYKRGPNWFTRVGLLLPNFKENRKIITLISGFRKRETVPPF